MLQGINTSTSQCPKPLTIRYHVRLLVARMGCPAGESEQKEGVSEEEREGKGLHEVEEVEEEGG